MIKRVLISALLVFTLQAHADVADTIHNSAIADHEATYTQEEKAVSPQSTITEALVGCNIAESSRIKPFFSDESKYECQENNNIYNSGLYKIFLILIAMISLAMVPIVSVVIPKIAHTFGFAKSTGNHEKSDRGPILLFVLSGMGVLLMPLIPTKTDNQTGFEDFEFNNKINLYTLGMFAAYNGIQATAEYFLFKEAQLSKRPFISTTLLNPKNKGVQQAYNAIQYGACIATVEASDEIDLNVYYNETTSTYNATSQLGGCLLEVSAAISPSVIAQGKTAGVDYKAVSDKAFEQYLNLLFSRGVALGTAIAQKGEPLPNTEPAIYYKDRLERGNEAAYNLAGLDRKGVSNLVRDAARMIGEDATWIGARYPGVEMSTAPISRSVQLCSNVDGGTSYFDKTITIDENLRNCVRTMCADSSSPTICGEAIGYFDYLANDNALKNPNMVTIFGKYIKEQFQTDAFKIPARLFLNSISVNAIYNNTESESFDARNGEKVFTVKINHAFTNKGIDWLLDSPTNAIEEKDFSGMFESALFKMITSDGNGVLGLDYFFDCLAHPNDAHRPSGRQCSNITNTISKTGYTFIVGGIVIKTGIAVNRLTFKNPAQKTMQTAAIRTALKDFTEGSNSFGTGALIAKVVGTLFLKDTIEDNFAPYGAELNDTDVLLLSIAYTNPQFNDTISFLGTILMSIGFMMMLGIPLIVAMGLLSIHILLLMLLISSVTVIGAFFRSIINDEDEQDEKGFFRPVGLLMVTLLGAFTYPILFTMALRYIDTLAIYQIVSFDSMMTLNGRTPQITDFSSIITFLFGAVIYVLFLMVLFGNFMKMAGKSVFVRVILIGSTKEDQVYTEMELSTKKKLI